MNETYDIAVVGSGFGGSLIAAIARRLGRSVILLEKGKHPRFAIGESSTPLSNILLEQLATRYELPGLRALSKWGTWQRSYPDVACGLKRGFTFYHHALGENREHDPQHQRELLVAASPHEGIADTHWFRAEVDHFFMRETQKAGVEYLDEVALRSADKTNLEVMLKGERNGKEIRTRAKFVIDATGPRGFLHHALKLHDVELPEFPATQALFSHFTGVGQVGDQLSNNRGETPPYPVDYAAVHHVFEGGWIWVLKFNNGITSAGVAATDALAEQLQFKDGAAAWDRLLNLLPVVKKQFERAEAIRPFSHIPRVSFRSSQMAGTRWAMLPSAAGFVDPLLSTGFPLTLLGVSRLAKIIEQDFDSGELSRGLQSYAQKTEGELLTAGRLIGSLYGVMDRFSLFVSLSMLYFAPASYAEAARRLGKERLAPSFLLHDDMRFGPRMAKCFSMAAEARSPEEIHAVEKEVVSTIEPLNIAGLANAARRNWYPVDAKDLLSNAAKLQSTPQDIEALLEKCGFWRKGDCSNDPKARAAPAGMD